jgi:hypothetical protein
MPFEIPFLFHEGPTIWTVDDVLTAGECAAMVAGIEGAPGLVLADNPLYRDQDRVIVDDPAFTIDLFTRLRPSLPAHFGPLVLEGLNPRTRRYRYRPGQRFAPHTDHWYQPDRLRTTLVTVLVYLNDDFEGGETRFYEEHLASADGAVPEQTIAPRRGRVALFQHKIRHEGCPVLAGTKYALRTDVVYAAPDDCAPLTFARPL